MTQEGQPRKDEPVEARVVEEKRRPAYRPRRRGSYFGMPVLIVLMIGTAAAAFLFRAQLAQTYDRLFSPPPPARPQRLAVVEPVENPKPEVAANAAEKESPAPEVEPAAPTPPVEPPAKPDRDEPVIPIRPYPVEKAPPGLAYAIVGRTDMSYSGTFREQLKVVVPADYKRVDYERAANAVVASVTKHHVRHALRILFFTDRTHLDASAAVATAIWAPDGNFDFADRARADQGQGNELKLTMQP